MTVAALFFDRPDEGHCGMSGEYQWSDEAKARLLGACDGMVDCLVKLKLKIAQFDGPYSGRFPAHHIRKIERRDDIVRPMRELYRQIERDLRACQAKYQELTEPPLTGGQQQEW
jgi:hypothetical protein